MLSEEEFVYQICDPCLFNYLHVNTFSCFCCRSVTFSKLSFSKIIIFGNNIRVSNSLDQDQDPRSVGHDLGSNHLQRSSTDDINCHLHGNS